MAPSTRTPTSAAPTAAPTPPTAAPTYWALFDEGTDSMEDAQATEVAAVSAGIGAVAIVFIILVR